MNKHLRFAPGRGLLAVLALCLPLAAFGDAGQVLFLYGTAHVDSTDGSRSALSKGATLETGDRITTGTNGRVQIRMTDGGLLALRPQTEFVIEDFNYPNQSEGSTAAADAQPRSFFQLVKGGFRSITGAIGQRNKSNYRVRTPVATIGIRGTDYSALYCSGSCASADSPEGLYVGVTSGGVVLKNDAGSLDLTPGQFGFTPDAATAPRASTAASQVLAGRQGPSDASDGESDEGEESPAVAATATDEEGNPVNLTDGGQSAAPDGAPVAFGIGSVAGASTAGSAPVYDVEGNLVGFTAGDTSYDVGTAQVVNTGRDENRTGATGMSWGRWSGGEAMATTAEGQSTVDLESSSLHYVTGADGNPRPELPTTGSTEFALVGNTNPTDNKGNVGTLGSASMAADFTSQTVDADVSLSFDETNQVWDASATDVDINSADATFDGAFDDVTVTDTATQGVADGSGDLSGFFTGDSDGQLGGAGMSYSLSDNEDTTVNGAAAFQAVEGGN